MENINNMATIEKYHIGNDKEVSNKIKLNKKSKGWKVLEMKKIKNGYVVTYITEGDDSGK